MGDVPLDLDAIQARADAATKGEWRANRANGIHERDGTCIALTFSPYGDQKTLDAAFIAHSREDVPALVAALREARAVAWDARKLIADGPYMAPEVYEPARAAVLQMLDGLLRLTGDKA